MKMALGKYEMEGGKRVFKPSSDQITLTEVDHVQLAIIRSWNRLQWDKKHQLFSGAADLEVLDKLSSMVRLSPAVEERRSRLRAIQEAVDAERVNPEPVPFYKYPVKLPLYAHQVRASNMCLLTFGWISPEGA